MYHTYLGQSNIQTSNPLCVAFPIDHHMSAFSMSFSVVLCTQFSRTNEPISSIRFDKRLTKGETLCQFVQLWLVQSFKVRGVLYRHLTLATSACQLRCSTHAHQDIPYRSKDVSSCFPHWRVLFIEGRSVGHEPILDLVKERFDRRIVCSPGIYHHRLRSLASHTVLQPEGKVAHLFLCQELFEPLHVC